MAASEAADPLARVDQANAAARIQPSRAGYIDAVQVYSDGALFQLYAAPGQVTDIALQEGEQLTGSGPVAAGDTVRWIIGDTESGTGANKRVHILVKPTRPDLTTNLVINTDRRTYHLETRSADKTYMASVSWQYPADQLIALRGQNAAADAAAPVDVGVDVSRLRFRYRIEGDRPAWRPLSAFDDEEKVFIEMPRGIGQGELPPLFVLALDRARTVAGHRPTGLLWASGRSRQPLGSNVQGSASLDAAERRLGGGHNRPAERPHPGDPAGRIQLVQSNGAADRRTAAQHPADADDPAGLSRPSFRQPRFGARTLRRLTQCRN